MSPPTGCRLTVQDLAAAEDYLQRSLALKRRLAAEAEAAATPRSAERRFEAQRREEAATLHHLAQVAVACKPARLDEAESLLQTALRLEAKAGGGGSARAGARGSVSSLPQAARPSCSCKGTHVYTDPTEETETLRVLQTLQQLGRVAIRRGQLDQAQRYLQQALSLHETAYGSEHHVNIATDRHQLGLVEFNRQRYIEAEGHLTAALRIRRAIYLQGQHVDVAVDLTALGRLERARGDRTAAERYLKEAEALLAGLPAEMQATERLAKERARVWHDDHDHDHDDNDDDDDDVDRLAVLFCSDSGVCCSCASCCRCSSKHTSHNMDCPPARWP